MKGAQIYSRLGWRLIPLRGKIPLIPDWPNAATSDPETLDRWATEYPDANLGVATGHEFFVLDVDPRNGGEVPEGLPVTVEALTPSGGRHFLFQMVPGVKNSAGRLGPGLDIRGEGGQIVIAPSVTTGPYRWARAPWDTPIAEAPAWLLERLTVADEVPSAPRLTFGPASPATLDAARAALALHGPAVQGSGGDAHTWQAAALLANDFALTDEEAWPLLVEWNATCTPPWVERELRAKLRGGSKYASGEFGGRRPFEPLERVRATLAGWDKQQSSIPAMMDTIRAIVARGVDPTTHELICIDVEHILSLKRRAQALPPPVDVAKLRERRERQALFERGGSDFIDPEDCYKTAQLYLESTNDWEGLPAVRRYEEQFYVARETHYEAISDEALNARLYPWLDSKRDVASNLPIKAERTGVDKLAHALRAAAFTEQRAPVWIDGNGADPMRLIVFSNGILDLETRTLSPHTRRLFHLNALPFPWQPDAPRPTEWLAFLAQIFDREQLETLQEYFGLCLTADTSHQKMLLVLGPKRSGKGTVLRILTQLVGGANVTAPTLAGLSQHFGLESLIGKRLAAVSDARLGARTDAMALTENLLRITGEDFISVPRKHQKDWHAKLDTRFLIISNEAPALMDQSGALASRFIVLQLTRSFLGTEDRGLTARLSTELTGICNWAIEGLDRLRARGHFVQPNAAQEAVRQLEVLGSPIRAFVEDRCAVAPGVTVDCRALFNAWVAWCADQSRDHVGTVQIFGRNLSAAYPEIKRTRTTGETGREWRYEGITLGG